MQESPGTISETIDALKKQGYTLDFNLQSECIICHQTKTTLSPDEFHIDKVYRFEGSSDPDDEAIVFAISSTDGSAKGTLVNGYGISADPVSSAMVEKLRTH